MFKPGDYVVYKRSVCKVKDISKNSYSNKDYYSLIPIEDSSLTVNIPVEKANLLLRSVITKEEAEKLIETIPKIKPIITDDKTLEAEYKKLMSTGTLEDLIIIIKTTYLRNYERKQSGKKIGDKDENYFNRAETYLYNELALSLNMTYNEVKDYVFEKVNNLCK